MIKLIRKYNLFGYFKNLTWNFFSAKTSHNNETPLNISHKKLLKEKITEKDSLLETITNRIDTNDILVILSDKKILSEIFYSLDAALKTNYLYEHFIGFLTKYVAESKTTVRNYFSGEIDLVIICKDFINFCFKNNVSLDFSKTLISFNKHDKLSDKAVKKELIKMNPRRHFNLFGFGLDEGIYEKELAKFLINKNIAKTVEIYGFDPYAKKNHVINYLTSEQLSLDVTPKFDLIISRWALHHVEFKYRWKDFANSIIHANRDALVLAVEHGFIDKNHSALNKKVYYLMNATFDILANIGLRPHYFTSTAPNIGSNFFINYLDAKDFIDINNSTRRQTIQNIYDVGPIFPNQTIYSLHIN